jgi:Pyridoxamine 5'-phosphate oxidase
MPVGAPRRGTIVRVTDSQQARDRVTRKADTLAMLATPAMDVWVATASPTGAPHLVPVSLAWIDDRVVIAVEGGSVTARNVAATGTARLALGPTRDVVMIDATLQDTVDVGADGPLGAAYVAQADWDPRLSAGYVFLVLRPVRVQAWREANEIAGRTLMRDGTWLV